MAQLLRLIALYGTILPLATTKPIVPDNLNLNSGDMTITMSVPTFPPPAITSPTSESGSPAWITHTITWPSSTRPAPSISAPSSSPSSTTQSQQTSTSTLSAPSQTSTASVAILTLSHTTVTAWEVPGSSDFPLAVVPPTDSNDANSNGQSGDNSSNSSRSNNTTAPASSSRPTTLSFRGEGITLADGELFSLGFDGLVDSTTTGHWEAITAIESARNTGAAAGGSGGAITSAAATNGSVASAVSPTESSTAASASEAPTVGESGSSVVAATAKATGSRCRSQKRRGKSDGRRERA